MGKNNYQKFFTTTKQDVIDIVKKQNNVLGFNAFALMSDIYKRENFHSDFLKAILDPNGAHNEKNTYLHLFYNLILKLAKEKNQSYIIKSIEEIYNEDNDIKVTREKGRTDIAIECEESKWVIIIENKLNNAIDQSRQLPKYYEYWTEQRKYKVIAIIYLTPTNYKKYPKKIDWKENDEQLISPYFLHISGYDRIKDCLYKWLKECQEQSNTFNNKAVFEQYLQLIKYMAGKDMDNEEKEKYTFILEEAKKANIDLGNLYKVIDYLPFFYALEIQDKLTKKDSHLSLWICEKNNKKQIVVIDDLIVKTKYGEARYFFDIRCNNFSDYGMMVGFREEISSMSISYEDTIDLLKEFLSENEYEKKKSPDDEYYYYFKPIVIDGEKDNFPTSEKLDKMVDFIYQQYSLFMEYLKKIEVKEL